MRLGKEDCIRYILAAVAGSSLLALAGIALFLDRGSGGAGAWPGVALAAGSGLTYAVWTALGTLGIVIVGAVLFHERLSPAQLICIGLCVAGVVGLKVLS